MTVVQVTALFDKLALTTHLQDLDIEAIGDGEVMKGVSPSLFARVIEKIPTVNVASALVTKCQILELLKTLDNDSSLSNLNISSNTNLAWIRPRLISSFAKLRKLNLSGCQLSEGQINILFGSISEAGRMRQLDISYNNLSKISMRVLTSILWPGLTSLNLSFSWLSLPQIMSLLTSLSARGSVRTHLDIRQNFQSTQIENIKQQAQALNLLYLIKI